MTFLKTGNHLFDENWLCYGTEGFICNFIHQKSENFQFDFEQRNESRLISQISEQQNSKLIATANIAMRKRDISRCAAA